MPKTINPIKNAAADKERKLAIIRKSINEPNWRAFAQAPRTPAQACASEIFNFGLTPVLEALGHPGDLPLALYRAFEKEVGTLSREATLALAEHILAEVSK